MYLVVFCGNNIHNIIHRDKIIFGHAFARLFIQIESSALSVNSEKYF